MRVDSVEGPGPPEIRIAASSGSITVLGEPRDDVVADGDARVNTGPGGSVEVVPHRGSGTHRAPLGAADEAGRRPHRSRRGFADAGEALMTTLDLHDAFRAEAAESELPLSAW